jgi:PAS domain-containing protein
VAVDRTGSPRGGAEWNNPLRVSAGAQKPLELILARNLLTSLSTPAFLVDSTGRLLFFNEAAGAMLGRSFEETGQMDAGEWTSAFGPLSDEHDPIPVEELSLTMALRSGRPAHGRFCIRSADGIKHTIEASAFPLIGTDSEESGAMILWWPRSDNGEGGG